MKKKFLSSILALAMVMAVFVPVMAEDYKPSPVVDSGSGSSSGTKVVTCEEAEGKGWVWSEAKKACVYSVTNTSTK